MDNNIYASNSGNTIDYKVGEDTFRLYQFNDTKYEVKPGDKLITIEQGFSIHSKCIVEYGDEEFWWAVLSINNIIDPFSIKEDTLVGSQFIIPTLKNLKTYLNEQSTK